MSATETILICNTLRPVPSNRTPPVAVIDATSASLMRAPALAAKRVNRPCQIPTGIAANATPQPRAAAKATEVNPSRVDFRARTSKP